MTKLSINLLCAFTLCISGHITASDKGSGKNMQRPASPELFAQPRQPQPVGFGLSRERIQEFVAAGLVTVTPNGHMHLTAKALQFEASAASAQPVSSAKRPQTCAICPVCNMKFNLDTLLTDHAQTCCKKP